MLDTGKRRKGMAVASLERARLQGDTAGTTTGPTAPSRPDSPEQQGELALGTRAFRRSTTVKCLLGPQLDLPGTDWRSFRNQFGKNENPSTIGSVFFFFLFPFSFLLPLPLLLYYLFFLLLLF